MSQAQTGGDLEFNVDGPVARVTFNRPQVRNALTLQMYRHVADICRAVDDNRAIRVLVFSGSGEKAFASGTDFAEFRAFSRPEDGIAYERCIGETLDALERCRVPTIAAIAGACTGGGFGIAACCDIRIAQNNARIGLPIARTLGNCLSIENVARFSAIMGPARFIEMMFTARLMGADEALAAGIVTEIIDGHAALKERAVELASSIAANAPLTLEVTKEALRRLRRDTAGGDDLIKKVYMSNDFKEGVDAFLNKRPPVWTGA